MYCQSGAGKLGGCVSFGVSSLKLVEAEMSSGSAVERGGFIGVVAANSLGMRVGDGGASNSERAVTSGGGDACAVSGGTS